MVFLLARNGRGKHNHKMAVAVVAGAADDGKVEKFCGCRSISISRN